jgi:hypothetical protein
MPRTYKPRPAFWRWLLVPALAVVLVGCSSEPLTLMADDLTLTPSSEAYMAALTYLDEMQEWQNVHRAAMKLYYADADLTLAAEVMKEASAGLLNLVTPPCLKELDRWVKGAAILRAGAAENFIQFERLKDYQYLDFARSDLKTADAHSHQVDIILRTLYCSD